MEISRNLHQSSTPSFNQNLRNDEYDEDENHLIISLDDVDVSDEHQDGLDKNKWDQNSRGKTFQHNAPQIVMDRNIQREDEISDLLRLQQTKALIDRPAPSDDNQTDLKSEAGDEVDQSLLKTYSKNNAVGNSFSLDPDMGEDTARTVHDMNGNYSGASNSKIVLNRKSFTPHGNCSCIMCYRGKGIIDSNWIPRAAKRNIAESHDTFQAKTMRLSSPNTGLITKPSSNALTGKGEKGVTTLKEASQPLPSVSVVNLNPVSESHNSVLQSNFSHYLNAPSVSSYNHVFGVPYRAISIEEKCSSHSQISTAGQLSVSSKTPNMLSSASSPLMMVESSASTAALSTGLATSSSQAFLSETNDCPSPIDLSKSAGQTVISPDNTTHVMVIDKKTADKQISDLRGLLQRAKKVDMTRPGVVLVHFNLPSTEKSVFTASMVSSKSSSRKSSSVINSPSLNGTNASQTVPGSSHLQACPENVIMGLMKKHLVKTSPQKRKQVHAPHSSNIGSSQSLGQNFAKAFSEKPRLLSKPQLSRSALTNLRHNFIVPGQVNSSIRSPILPPPPPLVPRPGSIPHNASRPVISVLSKNSNYIQHNEPQTETMVLPLPRNKADKSFPGVPDDVSGQIDVLKSPNLFTFSVPEELSPQKHTHQCLSALTNQLNPASSSHQSIVAKSLSLASLSSSVTPLNSLSLATCPNLCVNSTPASLVSPVITSSCSSVLVNQGGPSTTVNQSMPVSRYDQKRTSNIQESHASSVCSSSSSSISQSHISFIGDTSGLKMRIRLKDNKPEGDKTLPNREQSNGNGPNKYMTYKPYNTDADILSDQMAKQNHTTVISDDLPTTKSPAPNDGAINTLGALNLSGHIETAEEMFKRTQDQAMQQVYNAQFGVGHINRSLRPNRNNFPISEYFKNFRYQGSKEPSKKKNEGTAENPKPGEPNLSQLNHSSGVNRGLNRNKRKRLLKGESRLQKAKTSKFDFNQYPKLLQDNSILNRKTIFTPNILAGHKVYVKFNVFSNIQSGVGRCFLIPFFNIGGSRTQFDVEDMEYINKAVVEFEKDEKTCARHLMYYSRECKKATFLRKENGLYCNDLSSKSYKKHSYILEGYKREKPKPACKPSDDWKIDNQVQIEIDLADQDCGGLDAPRSLEDSSCFKVNQEIQNKASEALSTSVSFSAVKRSESSFIEVVKSNADTVDSSPTSLSLSSSFCSTKDTENLHSEQPLLKEGNDNPVTLPVLQNQEQHTFHREKVNILKRRKKGLVLNTPSISPLLGEVPVNAELDYSEQLRKIIMPGHQEDDVSQPSPHISSNPQTSPLCNNNYTCTQNNVLNRSNVNGVEVIPHIKTELPDDGYEDALVGEQDKSRDLSDSLDKAGITIKSEPMEDYTESLARSMNFALESDNRSSFQLVAQNQLENHEDCAFNTSNKGELNMNGPKTSISSKVPDTLVNASVPTKDNMVHEEMKRVGSLSPDEDTVTCSDLNSEIKTLSDPESALVSDSSASSSSFEEETSDEGGETDGDVLSPILTPSIVGSERIASSVTDLPDANKKITSLVESLKQRLVQSNPVFPSSFPDDLQQRKSKRKPKKNKQPKTTENLRVSPSLTISKSCSPDHIGDKFEEQPTSVPSHLNKITVTLPQIHNSQILNDSSSITAANKLTYSVQSPVFSVSSAVSSCADLVSCSVDVKESCQNIEKHKGVLNSISDLKENVDEEICKLTEVSNEDEIEMSKTKEDETSLSTLTVSKTKSTGFNNVVGNEMFPGREEDSNKSRREEDVNKVQIHHLPDSNRSTPCSDFEIDVGTEEESNSFAKNDVVPIGSFLSSSPVSATGIKCIKDFTREHDLMTPSQTGPRITKMHSKQDSQQFNKPLLPSSAAATCPIKVKEDGNKLAMVSSSFQNAPALKENMPKMDSKPSVASLLCQKLAIDVEPVVPNIPNKIIPSTSLLAKTKILTTEETPMPISENGSFYKPTLSAIFGVENISLASSTNEKPKESEGCTVVEKGKQKRQVAVKGGHRFKNMPKKSSNRLKAMANRSTKGQSSTAVEAECSPLEKAKDDERESTVVVEAECRPLEKAKGQQESNVVVEAECSLLEKAKEDQQESVVVEAECSPAEQSTKEDQQESTVSTMKEIHLNEASIPTIGNGIKKQKFNLQGVFRTWRQLSHEEKQKKFRSVSETNQKRCTKLNDIELRSTRPDSQQISTMPCKILGERTGQISHQSKDTERHSQTIHTIPCKVVLKRLESTQLGSVGKPIESESMESKETGSITSMDECASAGNDAEEVEKEHENKAEIHAQDKDQLLGTRKKRKKARARVPKRKQTTEKTKKDIVDYYESMIENLRKKAQMLEEESVKKHQEEMEKKVLETKLIKIEPASLEKESVSLYSHESDDNNDSVIPEVNDVNADDGISISKAIQPHSESGKHSGQATGIIEEVMVSAEMSEKPKLEDTKPDHLSDQNLQPLQVEATIENDKGDSVLCEQISKPRAIDISDRSDRFNRGDESAGTIPIRKNSVEIGNEDCLHFNSDKVSVDSSVNEANEVESEEIVNALSVSGQALQNHLHFQTSERDNSTEDNTSVETVNFIEKKTGIDLVGLCADKVDIFSIQAKSGVGKKSCDDMSEETPKMGSVNSSSDCKEGKSSDTMETEKLSLNVSSIAQIELNSDKSPNLSDNLVVSKNVATPHCDNAYLSDSSEAGALIIDYESDHDTLDEKKDKASAGHAAEDEEDKEKQKAEKSFCNISESDPASDSPFITKDIVLGFENELGADTVFSSTTLSQGEGDVDDMFLLGDGEEDPSIGMISEEEVERLLGLEVIRKNEIKDSSKKLQMDENSKDLLDTSSSAACSENNHLRWVPLDDKKTGECTSAASIESVGQKLIVNDTIDRSSHDEHGREEAKSDTEHSSGTSNDDSQSLMQEEKKYPVSPSWNRLLGSEALRKMETSVSASSTSSHQTEKPVKSSLPAGHSKLKFCAGALSKALKLSAEMKKVFLDGMPSSHSQSPEASKEKLSAALKPDMAQLLIKQPSMGSQNSHRPTGTYERQEDITIATNHSSASAEQKKLEVQPDSDCSSSVKVAYTKVEYDSNNTNASEGGPGESEEASVQISRRKTRSGKGQRTMPLNRKELHRKAENDDIDSNVGRKVSFPTSVSELSKISVHCEKPNQESENKKITQSISKPVLSLAKGIDLSKLKMKLNPLLSARKKLQDTKSVVKVCNLNVSTSASSTSSVSESFDKSRTSNNVGTIATPDDKKDPNSLENPRNPSEAVINTEKLCNILKNFKKPVPTYPKHAESKNFVDHQSPSQSFPDESNSVSKSKYVRQLRSSPLNKKDKPNLEEFKSSEDALKKANKAQADIIDNEDKGQQRSFIDCLSDVISEAWDKTGT